MTPILTTPRLILTPYTAALVTDQHVAWLNHPEIVKYSEQRHKRHTLESQHRYLNEFSAGSHIWIISNLDGDAGTISAHIDRPNRLANMGILIGQEFWGREYGKEAWDTVVEFLADKQDIRRVEAGMMRSNRPMAFLAQKCGMNLEVYIKGHFLLDGKKEDMLLYAINL